MATFNNLDDLIAKVDQAYQCARVGSVREPIELAEVEAVQQVTTVQMGRDFRDITLAEKKAVAEPPNTMKL